MTNVVLLLGQSWPLRADRRSD